MKKLILILMIMIFYASVGECAAPSRTYTYVTDATIDPDEVTTNEDNIFTYLQAGVDTYATGSVDADAIGANEVDASELKSTGNFTVATITAGTSITTSGITVTGSFIDSTSGTPQPHEFLGNTSGLLDWKEATTRTATGTFTRNTATATGTQTIAGVGFTPIAVIFFTTPAQAGEISWGFDDGTTTLCVYDNYNVTANSYNQSSSYSIFDAESSSNEYVGKVASFNGNGFVVTWTRNNTPTGTLTVHYLAIR